MKNAGSPRAAIGGLLLCFSFCLLTAASGLPATAPRAPLYVAFLDELPATGVGTPVNALDRNRRAPLFAQAFQQAVSGQNLSPVIVVAPGQCPPGTMLVRVAVTRWSDGGLGTFTDDEVLCRVVAEVVRDGRTVARLGPFLGRNPYSLDEMTTGPGRYLVFRDAARQALEALARALPR